MYFHVILMWHVILGSSTSCPDANANVLKLLLEGELFECA